MATQFDGKNVVVMGLGRFGGGIGVSRWLCEAGATVTVTDLSPPEDLADSVGQLAGLPIRFRLGGHDERDLDGCDLLVVSPAVPKDRSSFVAAAVARGISLSSEMNLFAQQCPARQVVGITGSAGKSTTTSMLGAILKAGAAAGALPGVWVGGNIGQSLLGSLTEISADDIVVLELSSFQLEDLGRLRWSPTLAVLTNVKPNHLDRHGTLEAYLDAKLNIIRFQGPQGCVFVHQDDDELAGKVRQAGAGERLRRFEFDERFSGDLRVPGRHNRRNAAGAIAVARELGLGDEPIAQGLRGFQGLPHRLEFVAERQGVRYYNDSKSTTPESSQIALEAFEQPVILLMGGRGKKMPYDLLARSLAERARAVVCYGEEAAAISAAVQQARQDVQGGAQTLRAASFEEAVQAARGLARPGDVVVLSPACVSYDMFNNYEHRGDTFRSIVEALPQ